MRVLRRGFWFAVTVAVAAGAVTFAVTDRLPDTYESTVTLHAAAEAPNLTTFGVSAASAPPMDLQAYASAARIHPVLTATLEQLGVAGPTLQGVRSFRARIDVDVDEVRSSGLLYVSIEGPDPQRVAAEANALGETLIAWDRRRSTEALQQIVATLEGQIAAVDQQIADAQEAAGAGAAELEALQALRTDQRQQLLVARTLQTSAISRLEMFEPAVVPLGSVAPNPVRNGLITGALALLLGYLLVLVQGALDSGVRDTEDLARVTQQPILAEFNSVRTRRRRLPAGPANFLRTSIAFGLSKNAPQVILVTSPAAGQGTTSVAISLAESYAHNGNRTLLIDADLRSPDVAAEYGLDQAENDSLLGFTRDEEDSLGIHIDVGMGHRLDVLPAPSSIDTPTQFLTRYFQPLLDRAASKYDVIVIDSAPVLPFADTLAIAPSASGVAMVVSVASADQRDVRAALGLIERSGSRVLGVVANRVKREGRAAASGALGHGVRQRTG